MAPEKITALIKGHRVGQYAAHGFKLYSRRCDNVVHDAKQKFALHKDLACHQKIRVLSDSASVFSIGMTAAAALPRSTLSNTSSERAQGITVHCGSMRRAASWLKEPSSPWMATFM